MIILTWTRTCTRERKILWEFTVQTDKTLEHLRRDIFNVDKEKRECIIIDLAVPEDQNITIKDQEKIKKHQDLRRDWKTMEC